MFAGMLALSCTMIVAGLPAQEGRETVADRAVRYVNDDIITLGDLNRQIGFRLLDLRRRGRPPPATVDEVDTMRREMLEQMTEEILLVQEADDRGVRLDKEAIRRDMLEWAEENGIHRIGQQAVELERRYRKQKINFILYSHGQKYPAVRPSDIREYYREHRDDFRRPARSDVLRILMRPSSAEERRMVEEMLRRGFRLVQEAPHPDVKATIDEEILNSYIDADDAERIGVLVTSLRSAREAAPADPDRATAALVAELDRILTAWDALRDRESVTEEMEAFRTELLTIPDPDRRAERFAAIARQRSQGTDATRGGSLGWIEPGDQSEAFDAVAFAETATTGNVSEVFWDGPFACLLLIRASEPGHILGLAEASARIQSILGKRQAERIRDELLISLRKRALIETIYDLGSKAPTD